MYRLFFKRLFDFVLSLLVLVIFSPLIVSVAIVLAFVNRGTPFFFQDRPGYLQKKIRIIKFKSMLDIRDESGNLLPDNQRTTRFGMIIRKLSIDELPQLINVLKGDMSLVGPRPLLMKYIPLYSETQRRRHLVRPGITGWAQVNGRNSISWTDRFQLDVYYVDHISFIFDLKIIFMTVAKVLKREGINQSPERPMQPFNGSN